MYSYAQILLTHHHLTSMFLACFVFNLGFYFSTFTCDYEIQWCWTFLGFYYFLFSSNPPFFLFISSYLFFFSVFSFPLLSERLRPCSRCSRPRMVDFHRYRRMLFEMYLVIYVHVSLFYPYRIFFPVLRPILRHHPFLPCHHLPLSQGTCHTIYNFYVTV